MTTTGDNSVALAVSEIPGSARPTRRTRPTRAHRPGRQRREVGHDDPDQHAGARQRRGEPARERVRRLHRRGDDEPAHLPARLRGRRQGPEHDRLGAQHAHPARCDDDAHHRPDDLPDGPGQHQQRPQPADDDDQRALLRAVDHRAIGQPLRRQPVACSSTARSPRSASTRPTSRTATSWTTTADSVAVADQRRRPARARARRRGGQRQREPERSRRTRVRGQPADRPGQAARPTRNTPAATSSPGTATETAPYQTGANDAYQGNTGTVSRQIAPEHDGAGERRPSASLLGSGTGANDGLLLDTLRTISSDLTGGNDGEPDLAADDRPAEPRQQPVHARADAGPGRGDERPADAGRVADHRHDRRRSAGAGQPIRTSTSPPSRPPTPTSRPATRRRSRPGPRSCNPPCWTS